MAVPVLVGLWQPLLLLPMGLGNSGNATLEAVLIHELAHLRQGHLGTLTWARLTGILLWWHPLVWLTEARLRATAEEICDDWAVALTDSRQGYAETLVQWAEGATRAAGGLAFVRGGHPVVRRVRRILTETLPPVVRISRRIRWGLAGGMAILLLGLVGVRLTAQPPRESIGMVEGTVSGPEGPLSEGRGTVALTLREGATPEWSEEQFLQPNGYFLFPQVPSGKYSLRVLAEGFYEQNLYDLNVREESTNYWDLKLTPQKAVRGRIFQADGIPLADTPVTIYYCELAAQGNPAARKRVTTDGAGRYEFQVEEGSRSNFQVVLMHPEKGYAFSPVLPYVPGEPPPEVDLHLSPGCSLSGVIREKETQVPIPHLDFSLRPLACLLDITGWLGRTYTRWPGRTDATGAFSFPHLAPGIYELSVGLPLVPYLGKKRVLVRGEKGETTVTVDWELPGGRCPSLPLQLRLPDGSPVAHTPVDLALKFRQTPRSGSGHITSQLRTDDQGQLRVPLSTGEGVYHVTITITGYPPATVENIWVFGEGPAAELEITFPEGSNGDSRKARAGEGNPPQ